MGTRKGQAVHISYRSKLEKNKVYTINIDEITTEPPLGSGVFGSVYSIAGRDGVSFALGH